MDSERERSVSPSSDGPHAQAARAHSSHSEEKNNDDVVNDTTIVIDLSSLPNFGDGQKQECFKNTLMPAKLYGKNYNIEDFLDGRLSASEKLQPAWQKWLRNVDLAAEISNKDVLAVITADLGEQKKKVDQILGIHYSTLKTIIEKHYVKRSKLTDMSSDKDRRFLHLLVNCNDYYHVKNPEITTYLKNCNCHLEAIRLIEKYGREGTVNTVAIRNFTEFRPNRRFNEIFLFLSQYLGRAIQRKSCTTVFHLSRTSFRVWKQKPLCWKQRKRKEQETLHHAMKMKALVVLLQS
jgi:hypothetical protein